MGQDRIARELEALSSPLDTASRQKQAASAGMVEPAHSLQLSEELQVSLEELRVTEEELRQQNEELHKTRNLLESERQYFRELFELTPVGHLVTDQAGKIIEANFEACRLFNLSLEYLVGKLIVNFVPLQDRKSFRVTLGQLVQSSRIEEFKRSSRIENWELRLQARQGPLFEAAVTIAFAGAQGNGTVVLNWLVRDISEYKRVQAILQESETKFRTLAESTSAAIFIVQNNKIRYVNPAATSITGYTAGELAGLDFIDIVDPEHRKAFKQIGVEKEQFTLYGRQPGEHSTNSFPPLVIRLMPKHGEECWVEISIGRMNYERGQAYLLTAFDITEQEKAKKNRQELLRRLVSVQEEERHRISRELHDQMGQDVTALILGLKSLETRFSKDLPSRELLVHLKAVAVRLGREVHHLAFELRPSSLDDLGLPTTLQNYADEWSERHNIRVDYQATCLSDLHIPSQIATNIYRIIQEALTNVLKHASARRVSIILNCHLGQINAIVEDDGCGFDLERSNHGRGKPHLGLLGMKERAELMGGTFTVESESGQGTTVYIRVPLSRNEFERME